MPRECQSGSEGIGGGQIAVSPSGLTSLAPFPGSTQQKSPLASSSFTTKASSIGECREPVSWGWEAGKE